MSSRLLDLLDLNELSYIQSTDASVALNSQQRKFYPEKTTYKSPEVIRFVIQGRQFLDMKKTSLRMDVVLSGANTNFQGGQSLLNFVNRVRVVAPNGKDISDVRKANLLAAYSNKLYRSENWSQVINISSIRGEETNLSGSQKIALPLRFLSPFFNNDQLLPPEITEHMVVEIYLEKDAIATPTATTYTIENPELVCQMSLMNNSITKAINMMSKKQLVYEFEDFVHTEHFSSNSSNDLRFHLTHSLTNALEVFTTLRNSADAVADDKNSFRGIKVEMHGADNQDDQLLYRVGDLYSPQQKLLGGTNIYDFLIRNRDAIEDDKVSSFYFRQQDFELTATNGIGVVYFCNLRRSKLFNTSGREISNQNSLMVEIKYYNNNATINAIADMFCKHVARVVIRKGMIEVER